MPGNYCDISHELASRTDKPGGNTVLREELTDLVQDRVEPEAAGQRLDHYLARQVQELSRTRIQELINTGAALVNQQQVKPGYRLRAGDDVSLMVPEPRPTRVEAQDIPLEVIFEDDDLIVINKPQGMVVHPAPGNPDGTLVNALLAHCRNLSGIGGVIRPGIVHRIDKDTSGLLLVAKNDATHRHLAEQVKRHEVKREYRAVVYGHLPLAAGTINLPIGRNPVLRKQMAVVNSGRQAVTHYRVLETFTGYSWLALELETGRTHQIRVHLAYIGNPVIGDPLYGPRRCPYNLQGQALHALRLSFIHPHTGALLTFTAPLPQHLQRVLTSLRHPGQTSHQAGTGPFEAK